MEKGARNLPRTLDEHTFLQLLEGPDAVQVYIEHFGPYFVPCVYITKPDTAECERYGIIVRNKDMFAAKTREALLEVLRDIAGDLSTIHIAQHDLPEPDRAH